MSARLPFNSGFRIYHVLSWVNWGGSHTCQNPKVCFWDVVILAECGLKKKRKDLNICLWSFLKIRPFDFKANAAKQRNYRTNTTWSTSSDNYSTSKLPHDWECIVYLMLLRSLSCVYCIPFDCCVQNWSENLSSVLIGSRRKRKTLLPITQTLGSVTVVSLQEIDAGSVCTRRERCQIVCTYSVSAASGSIPVNWETETTK